MHLFIAFAFGFAGGVTVCIAFGATAKAEFTSLHAKLDSVLAALRKA